MATTNNNTFRNVLLVGGGLAFLYWYFNIRKKEKVNPQDAIDGKTTFYSQEDDSKFVRGYPLPKTIDKLKPDAKGEILITTKPDANIFGTIPQSGIKVIVDKESNSLIYKFSPVETWIQAYDTDAINNIISIDQKYK